MKIADDLRAPCPVPDPAKAKGANAFALQLEHARLCEWAKRQAILSVIDSLNAAGKK